MITLAEITEDGTTTTVQVKRGTVFVGVSGTLDSASVQMQLDGFDAGDAITTAGLYQIDLPAGDLRAVVSSAGDSADFTIKVG